MFMVYFKGPRDKQHNLRNRLIKKTDEGRRVLKNFHSSTLNGVI